MNRIFISHENEVIRSASVEDAELFVARGWRELTEAEIQSAGMAGFEQYVSPASAVVMQNGNVAFTPPDMKAERIIQIRIDIANLEAQQTDRRVREAALTDTGKAWLQNLEDQIAAKRAELAGL
jgi:hypothetical protein